MIRLIFLLVRSKDVMMKPSATTKMSSKGQVVIPEEIRNALGLKAGSKFVVVGEGDVVILKMITPPSMSDFDDIIQEARRQARQAGMKRSDVTTALRAVRAGK
jgi:AbrB family looped-hinge helix DNA binding protein